jgi:hypothetical protein
MKKTVMYYFHPVESIISNNNKYLKSVREVWLQEYNAKNKQLMKLERL